MTDASAVTVTDVTKKFGSSTAVDNLSMVVRPGEVHGFLGPNGAGKSTTIRMILGAVKPDSGRISVLGADPAKDPAAATARTAYVPGEVQLWPHVRAGEVIATLAAIRACAGGRGDHPQLRQELIDRFELDPSKKVRSMSKGNKQKILLVAAFAADADVLVLDEPTSGLDPLMEQQFAECVRQAVGRGQAVLLSSHILSEVQQLADTVTIIRNGAVVEQGALSDLTYLKGSRISAVLPGGQPTTGTYGPDEIPGKLMQLVRDGATGIECRPPTLEEGFLDAYRSGRSPR